MVDLSTQCVRLLAQNGQVLGDHMSKVKEMVSPFSTYFGFEVNIVFVDHSLLV